MGTAGGGMDQTISLMAKQGHMCFIHFMPSLKAEFIKLP